MSKKPLLLHIRVPVLVLFLLIFLASLWSVRELKFSAAFNHSIPQDSPIVKTYLKYASEFGGANQIYVAMVNRRGSIYTPQFLKKLDALTNALYFIKGVDKSSVKSLFTPNVRFTEIVEGGFSGGTVIPENFQFNKAGIAKLKSNISKSEIGRQLVSPDRHAVLLTASLIEDDRKTGKLLNYFLVSRELESNIRQKFQTKDITIHITGFAPFVGAVKQALMNVFSLLLVTIAISFVLLLLVFRKFSLATIPLVSSLFSVSVLLALHVLLGLPLHLFGILVPFLVFAIGVSHAIQMIRAWQQNAGHYFPEMRALKQLLWPSMIALISDCIGFLTVLLIDVPMIRDMAISASIGVAILIVSNLILVPVLLSWVSIEKMPQRKESEYLHQFWNKLSGVILPSNAAIVLVSSFLLLVISIVFARQVVIGEQQDGVPELPASSQLNQDIAAIEKNFKNSTDKLVVYFVAKKDACVDYHVMKYIDEFSWYLKQFPFVLSISSLPQMAKEINVGWHEGDIKWYELPRNPAALGEVVAPVETSSHLLNHDCSVLPVWVSLTNHTAKTIDQLFSQIKYYRKRNPPQNFKLAMAGGNVAIYAASNREVAKAQLPILATVYLVIFLLVTVMFRSLVLACVIILPLGLVSLLSYALMALVGIGLTVPTLPVMALGAGIGVDYSIYLLSYYCQFRQAGISPMLALHKAYSAGGTALLITALTLSMGVITWIGSDLKYQSDMGVLLIFMFIVNMLAAVFLMPALLAMYERYRADGKNLSLPEINNNS